MAAQNSEGDVPQPSLDNPFSLQEAAKFSGVLLVTGSDDLRLSAKNGEPGITWQAWPLSYQVSPFGVMLHVDGSRIILLSVLKNVYISPLAKAATSMPDGEQGSGDQPNLDDLLPLSKAAERCGLSASHLRLLVREGEVWGKKIGRNWVTTEKAIREYLARDRRPGPKSDKGS